MVQESWPWPGTTIGDAGPYSDNDWDNMWETLYGSGEAPYGNRGVIRNWLNELEVTNPGLAGQVDVGTGAALVHGKFYRNTAVVNVTAIPQSVGAWREDTILLRSVWGATQTIRIYRHQNPNEGVGYVIPPSIDGTVWYIPLAAVRIDNVGGGTITQITDLREYVSDLMQVKEIQVPPSPNVPGGVAWVTIHGLHSALQNNAPCDLALFEIAMPDDFISCVEAYVVVTASDPQTIDWTFNTAGGSCDEIATLWTDSVTDDAQALAHDVFKCLDVTVAFQNANIKARDIVGCKFVLDAVSANYTRVVMLIFRYR